MYPKFQFHFGSIGSVFGCCWKSSHIGFNSTLVRLEGKTILANRATLFSFQFHFGSIGSCHLLILMLLQLLFQFHFGSIGRNKRRFWNAKSSEFQFHFGSIGSETTAQTGQVDISFNSTLVRLEAKNW